MSDYLQPDFYRFNEDSLTLVEYVASLIPSCESILDLGAGSGVIGLELSRRIKTLSVGFVELQQEFIPYLEKNISLFSSVPAQVYQTSFKTFYTDKKFDLIVSNPPYYLPGHGQASANAQRNIARTFRHDGWNELLSCIKRSLGPMGHGFIVAKDNPIIRNEIESSLPENLKLKIHQKKQLIILELTLTEHIKT